MSNYTIEQCDQNGNNYEPIPEGEFETETSAIAAMHELEKECGWTNMRVVDCDGNVVAESE